MPQRQAVGPLGQEVPNDGGQTAKKEGQTRQLGGQGGHGMAATQAEEPPEGQDKPGHRIGVIPVDGLGQFFLVQQEDPAVVT